MATQAEPKPITFNDVSDMPPLVMTLADTRMNKTGSWKYVRPVYHNKTAPCSAGCPAGNDIQAVMTLVRAGDLDGAWRRIVWENPFPAITGRVCYHPCEGRCNRAPLDEAVSIQGVERFVGDYGLQHGLTVQPLRDPRPEKVAVVGTGPAGLSAAYHLSRLGYTVHAFEAAPELGGVLRYGIPEYRLPKDVLDAEINRLEELGVSFLANARVGSDLSFHAVRSYDGVFLATGAGRSRQLNVPGEELDDVLPGLEFLRKLNHGEFLELGERVAVIGGGNTAMDVARSARRMGKQVSVLYRRTRHEMPASQGEIDEALAEGIAFRTLMTPTRVLGEDGHVTGIELVRMELGEPDASGRQRPVPVPDSEFVLEADTVITAIGEQADLGYLAEALSTEGHVVRADELGGTSLKGVFAGGDIVDQPHTVVDAIASGKRAAMALDGFFNGTPLHESLARVRVGDGGLSMRRYAGDRGVEGTDPDTLVAPEAINPAYFARAARTPQPHHKAARLTGNFDEVNLGFDPVAACREAGRCFQCGTCTACDNCFVFCPDFAIARGEGEIPYVIDLDYCKGCGICAQECPRGVIDLVPEGADSA